MRARLSIAWLLAALIAALLVVVVVLDLSAPDRDDSVFVWPCAVLMTTGVGIVLAIRRPGNPVGWLMLAQGLVLTTAGFAEGYARWAVLGRAEPEPGAAWAVAYDEHAWPLLFAPFAAIAYLFPDGRLPSPRWRRPALVALAGVVVMVVLSPFSGEPFPEPYAAIDSPLPRLSGPLFGVPRGLAALAMVGGLVGAALAVRARLRASAGVERRQVLLLAYAATLVPATLIACWGSALAGADIDVAAMVGLVLMSLLIPLAIGVAVLRYRLYEIDRVVNRTLVYVLLTALLAGTYAVVALVIGVAAGAGSTVPTAAATLAVALAFGPLRARTQRVVDRRFSRRRYDGLRRVEEHLAALRAGAAAPEATGAVLAQALGDPELQLVFRLPDADGFVDAQGRHVTVEPDADHDVTPVRRGPLPLGAVRHARALSEQRDVLESVIDRAGLAIEIARLRADVARRLTEVEESRERIVTATYEERRRLERDLHDGAQQRLVSIGLQMRNLQGRLPADDPTGARHALDGTVGELTLAIEELRELARGVRPGCLDQGLGAALQELASRSALATEVDATAERFDGAVEAAAYFVASEALTNSAKHAGASHVRVRAARTDGTLVLSVRDDGRGGARPSERSGLAGISDRVAALGGSVRIWSPPGEGTEVVAELPCGS